MSTTANPEARSTKWLALAVVAPVLLLVAGLIAGVWWWLRPAVPPEIRLETVEADIATAVLATMQCRRRQPFGAAPVAFSRQGCETCRTPLEACAADAHVRQKACTQLASVCLRQGDKDVAATYRAHAARLHKDTDVIDPYV